MEVNIPVGAGTKSELIVDSSVLADGTIQTILTETAAKIETVVGWLNLNQMDAGDAVTVRWTIDGGDGEGDVYHATEVYEDAQVNSKVFFVPHKIKTGTVMKVTIQQTAGVYRTFFYDFMREA